MKILKQHVCPICGRIASSEEEINLHLESCLEFIGSIVKLKSGSNVLVLTVVDGKIKGEFSDKTIHTFDLFDIEEIVKNASLLNEEKNILQRLEETLGQDIFSCFFPNREKKDEFVFMDRKIKRESRVNVENSHFELTITVEGTNEEKIDDCIRKQTETDEEIIPEMSLFDDLDMDSLDMVELAIQLEEEFDIEISDKEIKSAKIVRDIYMIVENKDPGF